MAVWMGTDNRLWSEYWYNNGSGNSSYSVQVDASALDIGSAPSIAGSPAGNAFDIAWQGTDGRLWLAAFDPSTKHFSSPEVVSIAGQLGSAPSIAEGIGSPNTWIFWKGRNDSHLWEAFWNASTSTWSLIDRGMGPLGPTG